MGHQPHRKKLPPMVPDFSAAAVACIKDLQDIPVPVLTKLSHDLVLMPMELQPITLPKGSRFLRFFNPSDSTQGGVVGEPDGSMSKSVTGADLSSFPLRAVFELPWAPEEFVQKAARMGHPALSDLSVPEDLDIAMRRNLSWSVTGVSSGWSVQKSWRQRRRRTGLGGQCMCSRIPRTNVFC